MKYGLVRKLNLANINKEMYSFETEDIVIDGADSFDEACQKMEVLVAERRAYHKAVADVSAKTDSPKEKTEKVVKPAAGVSATPPPDFD